MVYVRSACVRLLHLIEGWKRLPLGLSGLYLESPIVYVDISASRTYEFDVYQYEFHLLAVK